MKMFPRLLPFTSFCMLANLAVSQTTQSSNCIGVISSLDSVSAAVKCTTVNIRAFTVPAGKTFNLNLLPGTTVNVLGEIQFGNISWGGPLFQVRGTNIKFNGNGEIWDGGGPFHWDGFGTNNGTIKPHPMMNIMMSGTLSNVHVVNSPAHAFALNNPGPLTVSGVTVDNSQGNAPNAKSNGLAAGHNTDGFDVVGNDLVIEKSKVINQDDCLALNSGQNITFCNNYCGCGHGISIGSITSNVVVKNVLIQGNTVVNSAQAFRIKTDQVATKSSVSSVNFTNNVATGCTSYGVLITQSYPAIMGSPGNGVVISDINFYPGTTTVAVAAGAQRVAVDCGTGTCKGTWNWSGLKTTGGKTGQISNVEVIGYTP